MKMFNRARLPIIATLCSLSLISGAFAGNPFSSLAKEEERLLVSPPVRRAALPSNINKKIPTPLLSLIADFAGTKWTHGVCEKWRAINLTSSSKWGGRGSFCIKDYDTEMGILSKNTDIPINDFLKYNYHRALGNFPVFGCVRKLTLDKIDSIKDVSPFCLVENLTLSRLFNVEEVSVLGNGRIKKLTLINLFSVREVSGLCKIPDVTLRGLIGVNSVSELGSVKTLTLDNLCEIKDVSALGGVKNLTLSNMGVKDVSALRNVKTLTLDDMPEIDDVSALGGVENLTLKNMRVKDVSGLSEVENLRTQR
ncbi:MAG: hypothetical protein K0R52_829 [Alphaproteobacteria bacterium]|nr:hypothetical protein [Alphaproteobacteria bacterium]